MKKNILAENMRRFGTKNLKEEKLDESSFITKLLRKLGWAGEWGTPQELASQIKTLTDDDLIAWSKDRNGIPNTPLAFQQKLVKIEMDKRGISAGLHDNDLNNNGYPDNSEF
jgi:hypothetical protein